MFNPLESLFDADQTTANPRPDMRAQRMELLARFASYQVEFQLIPGDLVEAKPGMALLRKPYCDDHAFMLWRFLDPSDPVDAALSLKAINKGSDRVDCIVVNITDDGIGLTSHLVNSRKLMPLSSAAKQALEPMLQVTPAARALNDADLERMP